MKKLLSWNLLGRMLVGVMLLGASVSFGSAKAAGTNPPHALQAPLQYTSSGHALSFQLGEGLVSNGTYDRSAPLDIDSTLKWTTFLGGTGHDEGTAIALGKNGDVYVVGSSSRSWGKPIRAYRDKVDAFVAKINSDSAIEWLTFIGGNGDDDGQSIAVDDNDNVYVTGFSDVSWGKPIHPIRPNSSDAYLAKLDSNGALQWNTFFGASGWGWGVAVDRNGNAYVSGASDATWGNPKRAYTAGIDTFVAKVSPSGELKWNTFLGGVLADWYPRVKLDGSGNIYVSGMSAWTWGTPVRGYTGDYDNFVAKLDHNGVLLWNTFMGGGSGEYTGNFVVDASENVYLTGMGWSNWDTPKVPGNGLYEAYLVKVNANGGLEWSTFLGSSEFDGGSDIALSGNNLYVVGWSKATWGTPWRAYTSSQDAFVAKLNSDGDLQWNAFFGGSNIDTATAIVAGRQGLVYVLGVSDKPWGTPKRAYRNNDDVFMVKILDR